MADKEPKAKDPTLLERAIEMTCESNPACAHPNTQRALRRLPALMESIKRADEAAKKAKK